MSKKNKAKVLAPLPDIKVDKRPKIPDPQISGLPLAWRFSGCDKEGPFAWTGLPGERALEVLSRLHEFETKNWEELKQARCHPIETYRLEKPARDRLQALERDDVDEVMTFHISGPTRVWAIQDANIMRVLWWDPEHQVYLTEVDRADREKRKRKRGIS